MGLWAQNEKLWLTQSLKNLGLTVANSLNLIGRAVSKSAVTDLVKFPTKCNRGRGLDLASFETRMLGQGVRVSFEMHEVPQTCYKEVNIRINASNNPHPPLPPKEPVLV